MARLLEYSTRLTIRSITGSAAIVLFLLLSTSEMAKGQDTNMDWHIRPDLWWNSVDGIRPGLQLHGWETGPERRTHRDLDAGVWIGTRWPNHPVSYHFQYVEPFPWWSSRQSGGAVGIESRHRDGLRSHGLFLIGRWNPGGDRSEQLEIRLNYHWVRQVDSSYRHLPQRWQSDWNELRSGSVQWQSTPAGGIWNRVRVSGYHQPRGEAFSGLDLQWSVRTSKRRSWGVESIIRSGWVGEGARPEFQYGLHSGQSMVQVLDPLWRSRGTLPPAGVRSGFLHPSSGLYRGFGSYEWNRWRDGETPLWRGHAGGEWRVWTPNPIQQLLQEIATVNHLVSFRTHLFLTSGYAWEGTASVPDGWFHEAGPGIEWRVEIPEEHTGFRGFSIRYDLPLWISEPETGGSISFRHSLGIHARFEL